eukprot:TRINITY_DN880_c1_g2_i4.p1 TRINITY_DN880_c1_g2~~TRINITY_DN880_c1_g2_i4.p1  ORF type:complete len:159 (-),score=36.35 TRINITY_DN880_c1_g2_i4:801-1277(-)
MWSEESLLQPVAEPGVPERNACKKLVSRLGGIAVLISSSEGKPTWRELISKALDAGVDLQARGRVYPKAAPLGPYQYLSFAAAVSEAEVNILTGETTILRADVLLDCGKSLNPAIDIGQKSSCTKVPMELLSTESIFFTWELKFYTVKKSTSYQTVSL